MDNTIVVKHAEMSHLPQIVVIENECFPDPWSEAMLQSVMDDHKENAFFVCLKGDKVIGYAMMWFGEKIHEGHIENIAVSLRFRGIGAGDILVCAMLDTARQKGIAEIFLEVRQSNISAQKLYKKHGFTTNGIRKDYYTKPTEDAILMHKTL